MPIINLPVSAWLSQRVVFIRPYLFIAQLIRPSILLSTCLSVSLSVNQPSSFSICPFDNLTVYSGLFSVGRYCNCFLFFLPVSLWHSCIFSVCPVAYLTVQSGLTSASHCCRVCLYVSLRIMSVFVSVLACYLSLSSYLPFELVVYLSTICLPGCLVCLCFCLFVCQYVRAC